MNKKLNVFIVIFASVLAGAVVAIIVTRIQDAQYENVHGERFALKAFENEVETSLVQQTEAGLRGRIAPVGENRTPKITDLTTLAFPVAKHDVGILVSQTDTSRPQEAFTVTHVNDSSGKTVKTTLKEKKATVSKTKSGSPTNTPAYDAGPFTERFATSSYKKHPREKTTIYLPEATTRRAYDTTASSNYISKSINAQKYGTTVIVYSAKLSTRSYSVIHKSRATDLDDVILPPTPIDRNVVKDTVVAVRSPTFLTKTIGFTSTNVIPSTSTQRKPINNATIPKFDTSVDTQDHFGSQLIHLSTTVVPDIKKTTKQTKGSLQNKTKTPSSDLPLPSGSSVSIARVETCPSINYYFQICVVDARTRKYRKKCGKLPTTMLGKLVCLLCRRTGFCTGNEIMSR